MKSLDISLCTRSYLSIPIGDDNNYLCLEGAVNVMFIFKQKELNLTKSTCINLSIMS